MIIKDLIWEVTDINLMKIIYLGIKLDKEKNNSRGDAIISAADSKVVVMSIKTNEELMIARDTYEIVRGLT